MQLNPQENYEHHLVALFFQIIINHYLQMQLIANLKENRLKTIAAMESSINFRGKKNPKTEYISNCHLQTAGGEWGGRIK